MFKCDNCEEFSKPGEPENKITVLTRRRIYLPRYKRDSEGRTHIIDPGGEGKEIVKEERHCLRCFLEMAV